MRPETLAPYLAALPYPTLLIGPTERIEGGNASAMQLFTGAAVGRHYITALRQPAVLDAIEESLRDGGARRTRYLGVEGRRETTWRVHVAGVPLVTGQGVLVTLEDITAVEEANHMRREFVANVSHELRTPLTSLVGFVETLKGAARDDAAARARFLDIMEREANRMARLVADLLSLSRVEEEERVRPTAPVELRGLIEGVAGSFEPTARSNGITLDLDLPKDAVHVPGDAGQLRQVLTNLVENAIKYGGRDKPVRITLSRPMSEPTLQVLGVRIDVTDRGEGIAAHHLGRLTERFYRVDSHRSREVGGTGLGLAIVKHIVNRHRGRLRIDSKLGEGSTFSIILPAV